MKYELTDKTKDHFCNTLYQIKALKDFDYVKAGDLGGWVASENNLSQEGNCWVYDDARVFGSAMVYDDARVCGSAMVYGDARVCEDAWVLVDARVCGSAWVYGSAMVYDDARVCGSAMVYGDARVFGSAMVYDDAMVYGDARVYGSAMVYDDARVCGSAMVYGDARVCGYAWVKRGSYENTPTNIARSDGYTFTIQSDGSIVAECRDFTPEEADEHWGNTNHHMHKESWAIVQALRSIQASKG